MDYKKQRKKLKLSQEETAKKLGISLYAYQLIERNSTKNPRPETLKKLKQLFGKEI